MRILHRAGRYQTLLQPSEPMTPRIIADLDTKQITNPWDLLSIAANCCGYSVRLNQEALEEKKASLSLSVLAQCLLNGEILHNGRPFNTAVGTMMVPEYIKYSAFSEFQSPTSRRSLTFNKSCRFINPTLSISGVQTRGHLWKLASWVMDTSDWPPQGGWVKGLQGRLHWTQRKQLAYLAGWLEENRYEELANSIEKYLERDAELAGVDDPELSFVDRFMSAMAGVVADAIGRGGGLILGCVWDADDCYRPYRGVFVWNDGNDNGHDYGNGRGVEGDFAFTASRPENGSSDEFDLNDLDRHVSFQVELEGEDENLGVPSLRIQRWLPGLCFFKGVSEDDVVFPWPEDLARIGP